VILAEPLQYCLDSGISYTCDLADLVDWQQWLTVVGELSPAQHHQIQLLLHCEAIAPEWQVRADLNAFCNRCLLRPVIGKLSSVLMQFLSGNLNVIYKVAFKAPARISHISRV
jgi:hypothetical protein